MAKQLTMYETLENSGSREVWRSVAKTFRSTYKVSSKIIVVLPGWNMRTVFEGIVELADDIEANGLNEPLEGVLSPDGKKFILTDGERRWKAIQLLIKKKVEGFDEIEVVPVPKSLNGESMLVRMISSGVQKSVYKDVEVANGLLRLKTEFNLSNEQIGGKMGRSRQWVDNMIKLAKAPEEVKEAVSTGKTKKTPLLVAMKDKVTDVAAGLTKSKPQPGLPASLKTDNAKGEKEAAAAGDTGNNNNSPAPTSVAKTDALQGVNYDKEVNEQEAAVNRMMKTVNKIEPLGKGLNDQGQKDLESYLRFLRTDLEALKTYYSKIKNRQVK